MQARSRGWLKAGGKVFTAEMTDSYYFDPNVAEAYDRETDGSQAVVIDDIPFYVDLAKQAGAAGQAVLELGCGTGRMTLPVARSGVEVVGLDNAEPMLEVARRKAEDAANPRWVLGDMADFHLGRQFGLVIIPFRSFLLLLTVEDQKRCLARVREHLLPGGRLALNLFNPSILTMADWMGDRGGRWQRMQQGSQRERWIHRRYHTASQELNETRSDMVLGDEGAVIQRVERNLRLRWVYRYEMEHLLALCGFEVEALYGWFDARPFTDESNEMIWVARPS